MGILDQLIEFLQSTGFAHLSWQMLVMWGVSFGLFYLAICHQFEPLLLIPIGFGALLANLPTEGMITAVRDGDGQIVDVGSITLIEESGYVDAGNYEAGEAAEADDHAAGETRVKAHGGLFDFLLQGIKLEIFPPIIFLGVGALTDFGPLIANPRMLLLGGAAQFGVLATFLGAILTGFSPSASAAIGIIGGADGPTAIFLANKLAPELLGAIAVAAYSYMALVPMIQPPIMRALTTDAERRIRMSKLRPVSKLEKICFALIVTIVCICLVPPASPLLGMLMLGNFLRECGVTERLVKASQNEIINIVTIFLGTSVGITMQGERFLQPQTLKIITLGIVAFAVATAFGVLMAKTMNLFSKNKINPLIGSAGVSAVPMAARVSHNEGQKYDSQNYLLMHAMGPNVAGVIGTAVIAGYFLAVLT